MSESVTIDPFDRAVGALEGLPDVTKTRPTTLVAHTPIIGRAQTFVVQTFRQADKGDTVFVQYIDGQGAHRFVFPPEVADCIARQRDALTGKVRSKVAKRVAQERKARGELPGFLKGRTR